MIPINRTYAPVQALVDELVRCGMRHAVTSPGSRNAPLALTLAGHEALDCVSVIDERAAGFMAVGMAKATDRPVAVTCTSGTAAANLAPAVHEAAQARVPLIVLTADRPPELREVGAGQAIDQVKLYGSAARWFVEVGSHEPSRETAVHHRQLGCRAYYTAAGELPGPVHLNFPLREPLAPTEEDLDADDWAGRPDGRPWTELLGHSNAPRADDVQSLATRMATAPRGAIVAGPTHEDLAEPVARLAAAVGWPILAEPTSGLRCGDHDRSHVVAHYDVTLRGDWPAPALVLRVGDMPTSKPLRAWLAGAPQAMADPHAAWHEPTRAAELILHGAAAPACDALAAALEMLSAERDPEWLADWRSADERVAAALAEVDEPFEPKAWAELEPSLGDGAIVWVASSMPIRDVEAFFPSSPKRIRFFANRGANGIDGTIASAAGAARATGAPVSVILGDLALLHDLGGLMAAARARIPLNVICANNDGGGIFDFLPVAGAADPAVYEEHIATPAGVDLQAVAALTGMEITEVRTDRAASVRLHRQVAERVSRA